MALFLVIFFLIYGTMNGYLLWTLRRGLGGNLYHWIVPALLFAAMTVSPLLLRQAEHSWPLPLARGTHLLIWTWMALIFWGDCLALLFDIWNGASWMLSRLTSSGIRWHCPYRFFPLVLVSVWSILLLWGLWEGRMLNLRTVPLQASRLPADTPTLRLIHVTDLHLGMTTRERRLEKLLELIRDTEPDVILTTGDIVDAAGVHMDDLMHSWQGLTPTFGKYAILGNHEAYAGTERSVELLEMAGFRLLRNEVVHLGDHWIVAGVDDPAVRERTPEPNTPQALKLSNPLSQRFVILLRHQPIVSESTYGSVDLQLSGHTHGGQIFPFHFLVRLFYPFPHAQLLNLQDGLNLYVSRGAGLWGPPLRVLAPAEVTLFVITPESP